jgi:hypothetical protein
MLQSCSYTCTQMEIADCRKVAYVAIAGIFTVTGQQCIMSMYILKHRSSCGTSRVRPSWPRSGGILNSTLAPSCEHASCCHAWLGDAVYSVWWQWFKFHPNVSCPLGGFSTSVQINITTSTHDTWHTFRYITLQLLSMFLLYTSSILLGRLAALCSRCLLQG